MTTTVIDVPTGCALVDIAGGGQVVAEAEHRGRRVPIDCDHQTLLGPARVTILSEDQPRPVVIPASHIGINNPDIEIVSLLCWGDMVGSAVC
jgi:hypothetical protein